MFCGAVRTIHLLTIGRKIYRKKGHASRRKTSGVSGAKKL
jgi:hypothetical protein